MSINRRISLMFFLIFFPVQQAHSLSLANKKIIQMCSTILKTVTAMLADSVNPVDVRSAKNGARLKLLSQIADITTKGLDSPWTRDNYSKALLGNAAFWRAAKHVDEHIELQRLQKEHGDILPGSVLEEYYGIKIVEEKEDDEDEYYEDFDDLDFIVKEREGSWNDTIRPVLHLIELGLSICTFTEGLTGRQRKAALVGQSVCSFLLRYVCSKEFRSKGKIGKIEAFSSLLPLSYDTAAALYKDDNLYDPNYDPNPFLYDPNCDPTDPKIMGPDVVDTVEYGDIPGKRGVEIYGGGDSDCPICIDGEGKAVVRLTCDRRHHACTDCVAQFRTGGRGVIGNYFPCPQCRARVFRGECFAFKKKG